MMQRLLARATRFLGLLGLFLFVLPSPAAATDVTVHCWCQQTDSLVCNHNTQTATVHGTLVDLAANDSPAARDAAFSDENRDTTCSVCRAYCAGLTGGTWRATHCESGYREEICGECYADASSSCTAERGARVPTGSTGASPTTELPQCPDAPPDIFPIHLGTPIGGVSQVNGLADYINIAYRYLVSVVLVVAIVMVVYGGFRYLFGASVGSVSAGKDIIRDALIGMLIVLGAYTILATINPATTILGLNPPERIACRELDVPDAVRNGNCQSDNDCPVAGQHCVETQFVFRTDTDQVVGSAIRTGGEAGAEAGGLVGSATHIPGAATVGTWSGRVIGALGTAAGAGYYALFNIGGHVKACSDGSNGAPCDSSDDCRPGLYCLSNWNLCTQPTGIARGAPCGPLDRAAGSTGVERATCADGEDACVPPAGTGFIESLAGGDYAICRGHVQPMLNISDFRSNNSRVPDEYECTSDRDCAEFGGVTNFSCIGPANPWRGRYCYPNETAYYTVGLGTTRYPLLSESDDTGHITAVHHGPFDVTPNVTPCVLPGGSGNVRPLVCNGTRNTQYTCVYCPSSGDRVWTYINDPSGNGGDQVGVCAEKDGVIGTPCAGG